MPSTNSNTDNLYNLILTQQAVNNDMPFDLIEKEIRKAVKYVETHHLNARISNVVLNIEAKLVLAQIYVERKNSFAVDENSSNPTVCNVQVRFPFGLETTLNDQKITIPAGEFNDSLRAYHGAGKVSDDVQRDYKPEDIVFDPETIAVTISNGNVTLKCLPDGEEISFATKDEIGKGYTNVGSGKEYHFISDYEQSLKIAGVFPLFYSQANQSLLRYYSEYNGATEEQDRSEQRIYEPTAPTRECDARVQEYRSSLDTMQRSILSSTAGKRWEASRITRHADYVFNITMINGRNIYTRTGLPVIRLRDYQLSLFDNCSTFINKVNDTSLTAANHSNGIAAKIEMGVGSGKTFFTFALLQHLKYEIQQGHIRNAPSFCLAPDSAVAGVTKKVINDKGEITGISALEITDKAQMPDENFLRTYQTIADAAVAAAAELDLYLNENLQKEILFICSDLFLHPIMFTALYAPNARDPVVQSLKPTFKETIDINRFVLLVEGQKKLRAVAGTPGITCLKVLMEIFAELQTKMNQAKELACSSDVVADESLDVQREKRQQYVSRNNNPLGRLYFQMKHQLAIRLPIRGYTFLKEPVDLPENPLPKSAILNYDQDLVIKSTIPVTRHSQHHEVDKLDRVTVETVNLTRITPEQLNKILTFPMLNANKQQLMPNDKKIFRRKLMELAAMADIRAAILFANSGSLGDTTKEEELDQQIRDLLPIAAENIRNLAQKINAMQEPAAQADETSLMLGHYKLFQMIRLIFNSIPEEINFKITLLARNEPDNFLKVHFLRRCADLHERLHASLQNAMDRVPLINSIDISEEQLMRFGITKEMNVIDAANKLAAIASLQVTGRSTHDDSASLLLSHVPIFTPEGLAAYIEHLESQLDKNKYNVNTEWGVYRLTEQAYTRVTDSDIKERLIQLLESIAIADEVHKEEFKFLYDQENSIYQRINAVIMRYFEKSFIDFLPNRIGMSGTINDTANAAFNGETLYKLTTQKMIQQHLTKQINIDTKLVNIPVNNIEEDPKKLYAKQLVINYFLPNNNLSIKNIVMKDFSNMNLFSLSKGLIFSKTPDIDLNRYIQEYFDLLIEPGQPDGQEALFEELNEQRNIRINELQNKLNGTALLSQTEIEHIIFHNHRAPEKINVEDGFLRINNDLTIELQPLSAGALKNTQIQFFKNNLYALYLEYMSHKNGSPKELSDIVGLQNALHEEGISLIEISRNPDNKSAKELLALLGNVNFSSISEDDIERFFATKIANENIRSFLKSKILQAKNKSDHAIFLTELNLFANNFIPSGQHGLITSDRLVFESGMPMVMLGTKDEVTGYSHEPISIVMDIPANINNQQKINDFIARLKQLNQDEVTELFTCLQTLAHDTFNFDEKNQAGGRALRTTKGQVKYVEYITTINSMLANSECKATLSALKLEVQFDDIFSSNEERANTEKLSNRFNRLVFRLLKENNITQTELCTTITNTFYSELTAVSPTQKNQIKEYTENRLPLLWAMKFEPALAAEYFANNDNDNELLDTIREQFTLEIPESIVAPIEKKSLKVLVIDVTATLRAFSNTQDGKKGLYIGDLYHIISGGTKTAQLLCQIQEQGISIAFVSAEYGAKELIQKFLESYELKFPVISYSALDLANRHSGLESIKSSYNVEKTEMLYLEEAVKHARIAENAGFPTKRIDNGTILQQQLQIVLDKAILTNSVLTSLQNVASSEREPTNSTSSSSRFFASSTSVSSSQQSSSGAAIPAETYSALIERLLKDALYKAYDDYTLYHNADKSAQKTMPQNRGKEPGWLSSGRTRDFNYAAFEAIVSRSYEEMKAALFSILEASHFHYHDYASYFFDEIIKQVPQQLPNYEGTRISRAITLMTGQRVSKQEYTNNIAISLLKEVIRTFESQNSPYVASNSFGNSTQQ